MSNMSSCNNQKLFIFTLLLLEFALPFTVSSPISQSPYDKFISFLLKNNCSMPKQLELPFTELPESSPFDYLSTPLGECRTPDVLKKNDEADILCTEVFDVLKNISCVRYESLPIIESNHLSTNVCHDFENLKGILPEIGNYLSGRLTDNVVCKLLCTAEKYELLCKTLLWSYDTLMKIENAVQNETQENGKKNNNQVSTLDKGSSPVNPSSQNMKEASKSKVNGKLLSSQENLFGSDLNQTDQGPHNQVISDDLNEKTIQGTSEHLPDLKVQDDATNKITKTSNTLPSADLQNKSEPGNNDLSLSVSENHTKTIESKNVSIVNSNLEHRDDDDKNKIDVEEKPPTKEVNDNDQETLEKKNLTPDITAVKNDQNKKNLSLDNVLNNENDKDKNNSDIAVKSKGKSEESVALTIASNNEIKNTNSLEKDNKSKQTNLGNQEVIEITEPKQIDYEGSNEVLPDIDSKLPESSTQPVLSDEDTEHQEDKVQDHYNDIENEGEYNAEYDNALPKNKEPEVKNTIAVSSDQMLNSYDNISPKNSIAQMTEEIAVISTFPEQEDGHFFFYFLSIVLIIMAGYLIFHNKQKIIALIVEGRHERRRRSHGAGYKKLETK